MKLLKAFAFLVLITVVLGCISHKSANATDASDGFYIGTTNTVSSHALHVFSTGGDPSYDSSATLRIHESSAFVPERVVVVSASSQIPGSYYVQVSGQGTEEMLKLSGIIFVANHIAYFGTGNRVGSSATVTLMLPSRKEADAVASALRKRYSLP